MGTRAQLALRISGLWGRKSLADPDKEPVMQSLDVLFAVGPEKAVEETLDSRYLNSLRLSDAYVRR